MGQSQFMLVFRYENTSDYTPSTQELNEQNQQWGQFIGQVASEEKLVSTSHLGYTSTIVLPDSSVDQSLYQPNGYLLSGNMVVTANSLEDAIEIAKKCPILHVGGHVEVRDIIEM